MKKRIGVLEAFEDGRWTVRFDRSEDGVDKAAVAESGRRPSGAAS